ncbi:SAM-dependent methyltransferase [Sphaerisporangium corydalis]|uniref:SAM-dependent methyltransferase n=1 Tax=Sphaerisporangium corydalis TaxID=1441875 RepID=A0ABV9EFS8_9ACTN|nr:SAM-dependent methyltransferase [Sphaerisporangium corydalis]
MTSQPDEAGMGPGSPAGVDPDVPNVARMYDYYLGGKDNYAADREAAQRVIDVFPQTPQLARVNRAFLQNAVRHLAGEAGIRQFLDIGSGLPTRENVHQVAQGIDPDARVVYVDRDPVALAHARALLVENDLTRVMQGDLRRPDEILAQKELSEIIDFSQPVAILLIFVLHFVRDNENPYEIVKTLMDAAAPGSYLVLSHAERDTRLLDGVPVYDAATSPAVLRSYDEIARFFEGLEPVDPRPQDGGPDNDIETPEQAASGVVRLGTWRSRWPTFHSDAPLPAFSGVARKN